jgi:trimeric autotransporter adhesin
MRTGTPYLLAGALAAILMTTTSALAGSGVGSVFNLGQVNTVNAQSTLTGNPGASPLLRVTSSGTAATIRADAGSGPAINGVSTSGTGQFGQSSTGYGLQGVHTASTGANSGVFGQTSSTDPGSAGVTGRNTAGGPGLQAIVNSNSIAPLKVNSTAKVVNLNADLLDGLDSTGLPYWKLGGNAGTTPGPNFLGTTDSTALELKVNGQRALRLEPTADTPNLTGGSSANNVAPGIDGATIGGGGVVGAPNGVTGGMGTVGGGWNNTAGGSATVAGGQNNWASGNYSAIGGGFGSTTGGVSSVVAGGHTNAASADYSAVGGGQDNTADHLDAVIAGGTTNTSSGIYSTVAGGKHNTASGQSSFAVGQDNTASGYSTTVAGDVNTASGNWSLVAGGEQNLASGAYSAVGSGFGNTASGDFSFAAGNEAKATQIGSFVWSDFSLLTGLTSPGANTFTVRAKGGIWLGTNSSPAIGVDHFIDTSTGAYLTTAGAWTNASDRAKKRGFRPLDKPSVLEKVARMPITSWSYKTERPSVRHIGPMAQDFYKAFGLGLDNKHITTIDEGGVALAAIQGLYRQNKTLQGENKSLRVELRAQNARLTKLEHAFSALSR